MQSDEVFEVDYSTSYDMIGISTSNFDVRGRYDSSKAKLYTYRPNDFFYLPDGIKTQTQSRLDYTAMIIGFSSDMRKKYHEEVGARVALDEPLLAQSGLVNATPHISMISDFIQSGGLGGQLRAESICTLLMQDIIRTLSPDRQKPVDKTLNEAALNRVIEYIDTYTDEKIDIEQLASLANVSRFHFSRLFKTSTGLAPYQYVVKHRIEKAKNMLHSTPVSIAEVSIASGFSSQSHFTEVFRRVVGTTPSEYRRLS